MIPQRYLELRNAIPFHVVSLGYAGITLYDIKELEKAQMGYSIDDKGNSLVGDSPGDWNKNWLVIGSDDLCGDPIFIDMNNESFPVYTTMHGEGNWEPDLISISFSNFIKALGYIKDVSIGRENPVELKKNPIDSRDFERIIKLIANENKGVSLNYWEMWLKNE